MTWRRLSASLFIFLSLFTTSVYSGENAMPKEESKAPEFKLKDQSGTEVSLAQFKGKSPVVLYFYPKDDTPGCTVEACGFRDEWKRIEKAGAVVLGVSPDSVESHQKFVTKFKLPFTLLADTEKDVVQKYGVWVEKSMYGKKYMGVARSTFVIDKAGVIKKIFEKVKPEGHADEVIEALKGA